MTIEQFAAAQTLPEITRYTLPNGAHVYRLQQDKNDNCVGTPVFALMSANGWRIATPAETFKIMSAVYGESD